MEREKVKIGGIYCHAHKHYVKVTDIAKMHGNPSTSMIVYKNLTTAEAWTMCESTFINKMNENDTYELVDTNEGFLTAITGSINEIMSVFTSKDCQAIDNETLDLLKERVDYVFNEVTTTWHKTTRYQLPTVRLVPKWAAPCKISSINTIFRMYCVPYTVIYSPYCISTNEMGTYIRIYSGTIEREIVRIFIQDFMDSIRNIKTQFPEVTEPTTILGMFRTIVTEIAASFNHIPESEEELDALWCYNYVESIVGRKLTKVISSNEIRNIILQHFKHFTELIDMIAVQELKTAVIDATSHFITSDSYRFTEYDVMSIYFNYIMKNAKDYSLFMNNNDANVLIDILKIYGISIDNIPHSTSMEINIYLSTLISDKTENYKFSTRCSVDNDGIFILCPTKESDNIQDHDVMDTFDEWLGNNGIPTRYI